MTVSDQDVFDVLGIEAEVSDVVQDVIDVGFLGTVDQDQSIRGWHEPRGNGPDAHVIEIVEDLERRNLLILDVAAAAFAKRLAQRLICRRLPRRSARPLPAAALPCEVHSQEGSRHETRDDECRDAQCCFHRYVEGILWTGLMPGQATRVSRASRGRERTPLISPRCEGPRSNPARDSLE